MAITGAHVLLFSPEAEAVRATLRDVIGWDFVEAHPGWLICDDLDATVDDLRGKGVEFTGEPSEEDFGRSVRLRLPGGVEVPLYEPKHALAIDI